MSAVRSIRVRDRNGEELTVYEFRDRRFLGSVRRLKLCTGELVEQIDEKTFAVALTGEKMSLIESC